MTATMLIGTINGNVMGKQLPTVKTVILQQGLLFQKVNRVNEAEM